MSFRNPSRAEVSSATEIRPDQIYQLVRYRQSIFEPISGVVTQPPYFPKRLEASGDTFSVVQINGPCPVYAKFGSYRNPWVRMHRRTVYKRSFRSIWFTLGDNAKGGGPSETPQATFVDLIGYASYGDFVEFQPMVPGVQRGFTHDQIAVPIAPAQTPIMANMMTVTGSEPHSLTSGIEGGYLVLRNMGAFPIDIFYGTFNTAPGYRMAVSPDPSSVLTLPLVGGLHEFTPAGSLMISDVIASGVGGASTLAVLLSPFEQDATIPEVVPRVDLGG